MMLYGNEHEADTVDWCGEHAVERIMCGCAFRDPDPGASLRRRFADGAAFILDAPRDVAAVWGRADEVLWASGESCILAGPPGVGKTTLTGQLVRGLLGLSDSVLGYPVTPAARNVLYLAMDRPRQISRALRRHFSDDERGVLAERLRVWPGPPPADLARNPGTLAALAEEAGASHVILDSLKDAALGLTEDEAGAGYNRARQLALAAGVEVLELHHVVKRGPNGARPNTLADLYGSVWLTAGAGSVLLLWGAAGDLIVDLSHLKQPAEPVGPLRVSHDHAAGTSSVWHSTDALTLLTAARGGITAANLAAAMYEAEKPDRNQIERARRKLESLTGQGLAERVEGEPTPGGGKPTTRYRAITEAITLPISGEAITNATSNHAQNVSAGQAITEPITAITGPAITNAHPPVRGVRECVVCGEPLSRTEDVSVHVGCEAAS